MQIFTRTGPDSYEPVGEPLIGGAGVEYAVTHRRRAPGRRPAGVSGAQATVEPIESGDYDTDLRRVDGEWRIVKHSVLLDTPIAIPGA
ncbi:hypothetical protein ACIO1C_00450 [Streptomyces sp. NPDC087420]|uniref:hypothetical protein n=1 Tax=Streptomyces sp. NPDC087420 TaxID=3365785 RepID=UPI003837C13C